MGARGSQDLRSLFLIMAPASTYAFLFLSITGINIKDGEIYPASFLDKGPDECVRHARIFGGIRGVSVSLSL